MKTSLFALLFLLAAGSWAKSPTRAAFVLPTTISIKAPPAGIAVGDLNKDGYADIVTANRPLNSGSGSNTTLSIIFNKGKGKFAAPTSITVGEDPSEVAIADFNGDGNPDLVVVVATGDSGKGDVEVLLGNGDGSFGPPVVIAVSLSPPIAVADFNGDGKPDIAVEGALGLAVFLGNGDGTFSKLPANQSCLADAPFAVGDFNGDGVLDIASLCATKTAVQNMVVLLGNGNGTFTTGQTIQSIGSDVQGGGIVAAKFTGTANLDLAISLTGPAGPTTVAGSLVIYTGNGQGVFAEAGSFPAEIHPKSPITADFNGDGYPDIAVPNLACDSLSIYLNNGTGQFSNPVTWTVGAVPVEVGAGDFNNDGFTDLAVTDNSDSAVAVLTGTGTGSFLTGVSLNATNPLDTNLGALTVTVGDFNNDGYLDVATSAGTLFLGNGAGGFTGPTLLADVSGSVVLTAKLSPGIDQDLVIGSSAQLTVLLGAGNGTFPQTIATALPGTIQTAITGDFNGDGVTDLVVLISQPLNVAGAYLYLGTYSGTFQTPLLIAAGTYTAAAAGAFHSLEPLSVVLIGEPAVGVSTASILQGYGNGLFDAPVVLDTGLASIDCVLTADVNRDNNPDLIFAGVGNSGANKMSILLGKGNDTFESPKTTGDLLQRIPAIVAADFNGDGKLDIAASQGNSVVFFLSQGGGNFVKQTGGGFSVPGGNGLAAAQLIPGAGWDLLIANAAPDSIWTFLNSTGK